MYDIYVYIGSMDVALVDQAVVFVSVMYCLVKKTIRVPINLFIFICLFMNQPFQISKML